MDEAQSILNYSDFLRSAPGRYALAWEQRLLDESVADIFGYYALQLGTAELDALRENRMPLRCLAIDAAGVQSDLLGPAAAEPSVDIDQPGKGAWRAGAGAVVAGPGKPLQRCAAALMTRFDDLPFASQSLDLLVLPHVLEFAQEPHRVLREADRVLVPEGSIVVTGFNPASLWGARHWLGRVGLRPFLPPPAQLIALPRLKDWLKLLSFEVNRGRFGCYAPSVRNESWIARWAFLEEAGDRWWPVLGSVYALSAVKRVHGMRLVGLIKRRAELPVAIAPAPAVVMQRTAGAANEPSQHAVRA